MTRGTLEITLVRVNRDDSTTPVEGVMSYDEASRTLVLDPFGSSKQKLAPSQRHIATVRGEELAGSPTEKVWSFTTGAR
jgi:hypothetical protein